MTVSFTVVGQPAGQGSKIVNRYGGMREASKKTMPWRSTVTAAAVEAWITTDGQSRVLECMPALTGPVSVRVRFYFLRPKSHFRTGRYADTLKETAPLYCTTTPDLDKCERLIGDALKEAGVVRDDSQIVHWNTWKLYGEPARAEITIEGAT